MLVTDGHIFRRTVWIVSLVNPDMAALGATVVIDAEITADLRQEVASRLALPASAIRHDRPKKNGTRKIPHFGS